MFPLSCFSTPPKTLVSLNSRYSNILNYKSTSGTDSILNALTTKILQSWKIITSMLNSIHAQI